MRKTVWILDDDIDFCNFIEVWLKNNYSIQTRAFTEISEFTKEIIHVNEIPTVILMDVRLRKGNGLKVSKDIHDIFEKVPIIHLTALDGDPIFEEEYTILGKPINDSELKGILNRYL